MAVTVWMLYAADRILDAVRNEELEARHHFHHRHRRAFLAGIALAALALAVLLLQLDSAAICLYLVEGALLAVWFLVLHGTRSAHRLPKEVAVGLFFSAAVFIPTIARAPSLRPALVPGAILLAALCSLNCLFIYSWEHVAPSTRPAHPTTRIALARLPGLAAATAIAGIALALVHIATPAAIPVACSFSATLLLVLHYNRNRLTRTNLRASADLALLTPILLLPFLR
jgi:hypothetical protein